MRAILTYHSVDDTGSPISVSREAFRAHCDFLSAGRVRVVPLQQLLRLTSDEDAVAITFDDGLASFWAAAAPELEQRGLPATVFVVTDHVGAHNDWGGVRPAGVPHLPLMTWEQVGRLGGRGFEVGAHTRTHPLLPQLPPARLEDELDGSAARLESLLGLRPETFAYPYGAVDDRSAAAVRARFALACTTELRVLRPNDDHALLPRLDMFYLRSAGLLERWGSAAFRSLLWWRSCGRRARRLLAAPSQQRSLVA